jgi:hypothetical protein
MPIKAQAIGKQSIQSNLLPDYERIGKTARWGEHLPDALYHAITQDYLPVYAHVDGLRAIPCPRARGKSRDDNEKLISPTPKGWRVTVDAKIFYDGPGYRLKGYWQILNDPESESGDASIATCVVDDSGQLDRIERDRTRRVGWLYRSREDPELPGSDSLVLVDDLFVRFDDLYVKMTEVFARATSGTALKQIERHAGNEAEVLRVALWLLSQDVAGFYRFEKSKKVNARKLAEGIIEQPEKWWTEGACPLSLRTCADHLRDIFDGEPRKK